MAWLVFTLMDAMRIPTLWCCPLPRTASSRTAPPPTSRSTAPQRCPPPHAALHHSNARCLKQHYCSALCPPPHTSPAKGDALVTKLYGPESLIPVPLPVQACDPMSPAYDSSLAEYVCMNLPSGVDSAVSFKSFVYDDGNAYSPLAGDEDRVP